MVTNIQQDDYSILKQNIIAKYIKLDLMDFSMNVLDEISGDLIEASISIDANSDIRRTCNISVVVRNGKYVIQSGGRIWMDRYVRLWVGYENIHSNEIKWYNQGVFLINAPTCDYDTVTDTLSFEGLDMMCLLTGLRNGQLEGLETIIPQGANVRAAILSTVSQLGNINKYSIEECKYSNNIIQPVPNDIQITQGGTVFDILEKLRDILPSYEIFFDTNGTFVYQQIPTGQYEAVIVDDDIFSNVVISENKSVDFENVKNIVEVWGKTHDIDYIAEVSKINGNNIDIAIAGIEQIPESKNIAFTPNVDMYGEIKVGINYGQTVGTYKIENLEGAQQGGFSYGGGFEKDGTVEPYMWNALNLKYLQYYISRIHFNLIEDTTIQFVVNYKEQKGNEFGIGGVDVSYLENINSFNNLWTINFPYGDVNTTYGVSASVNIPKGEHFVDIYVKEGQTSINYSNASVYFTINNIPCFESSDAENYYPLSIQSGIEPLQLDKDTTYLISWNGENWTFLGHPQAYAVAKDTNPNSPFCTTINDSLYNIRLVLYGGEYDNIYTDDLAQQRADYELWKRTRLEDSITLTCVPIPWIDVNQVVNYTPQNSNETHQYIIKSISTDYSDNPLQTINMIRYYPLYPNI